MARDPLRLFHPPVQAWFRASLGEPTRAQALGWPAIARGESTLLLAPTGSGKTLAAFLSAIDRLVWSPEPPPKARCRVVYVSPLKALAVDVERNLRAPLAGVVDAARAAGGVPRIPTVDVRTGDTSPAERARMRRTPPDILITTPESLYLLLTSGAREMLASVDTVILDEIHALVPTKRGAHLMLTLERLETLREELRKEGDRTPMAPLQRIGLSATQRPLDEVARYLGGFAGPTAARPVTIVDAGEAKRLDLSVQVPEIDMARLGELDELASGPAAAGGSRRSIWPDVHTKLVALIREHRSTLLFVNSRRLAERLASALNEVAGDEIALAHHGSVAREKRAVIEDRLKRGLLPAIVATSSLELGIDMGAIDLVVQIEAPPSVASGMQRIGRASHAVGGTPKGVLVPKHRADLLACAAATQGMRAGAVEETFYPRNPLDVLAQQVVAIVSMGGLTVDDLFALVTRAAPFAEVPRSAFDGVLDMLSGRYPSDDFAELRPRLTWDRSRGLLTPRKGAQRLAIVNAGTIPDRGLYGVFLHPTGDGKASRRVGELDEEMVFELREGEVFLLGASSWRADQITHDQVIVSPAAGEPGKMPFWHGDRPGRPRAFGVAIGALTRTLAKQNEGEARAFLTDTLKLDASAAANLTAYVHEQVAATDDVPSDRTIVVERFVDELGDHRVCVLSPFGSRVHAPWTTAILKGLEAHAGHAMGDVDAVWSDDGMVFRFPAADEPPATAWFFPRAEDVEEAVTLAIGQSSLFASRFRECAARALLLPRRLPGQRTPLWAQRKRAYDLLAVAAQHPAFPILLETHRECLRDVFDMPGLVSLLRQVTSRQLRVVTCDTRTPSPFASSVLFSFVANFIYDGDAPLAERRAQALTIDHAQLRELLGESELRSLLDPEVIEEHARFLQRLGRPVTHPDAVHDLLLSLGDLTLDELRARAEPPEALDGWLRILEDSRRVSLVKIAKEQRYLALEDIGRLRDALGVVPPRGVPDAFLEPVSDPLSDVLSRYARTHVPFVEDDVVRRFGLARASVRAKLEALVRSGKLTQGAFLPHGTSAEYCDVEVLRALRRKSLARLRQQVEPVDAAAYARFLLEWQAVSRPRRGPEALLQTVAQLEGAPMLASTLERHILPARVTGFRGWDLDALTASGQVVWVGLEPLGPSDGRIGLYLAENEALLGPLPKEAPGELQAKVRGALERRGAVFFADLVREVGGFPADVLDALWDLVWASEVTNDTLEPLRSLSRAHGGSGRKKGSGRAREGTDGSDAGDVGSRPAAAPASFERPRGREGRHRHLHLRSVGLPPGSEGRWSLRRARSEAPGDEATGTARGVALARALLERYGVLTREATHAEGVPGGFSAVYDVLKAMEEGGRIRRGYFIAERGATQFALAGADDRLRALRSSDEAPKTFLLATTDPANPYGAAIPWPASTSSQGDRNAKAAQEKDARADKAEAKRRPQRAAGTRVLLHDGVLLAWFGRGMEALCTFFPDDELARRAGMTTLATTLGKLVDDGHRRALLVRTVDGQPTAESPFAPALLEAGFVRTGDGFARRPDLRARPRDQAPALAPSPPPRVRLA